MKIISIISTLQWQLGHLQTISQMKDYKHYPEIGIATSLLTYCEYERIGIIEDEKLWVLLNLQG